MSENIPQAQTEACANDAPATRADQALKVGLRALVIALGVFFVWAIFAPLDEGVPTAGTVSIDTKRKAIQHPTGGIVRRVLVREGEYVKSGQVLLQLDEATARANYEAARQQYLGARAAESRLLAEQAGMSAITFPTDLESAAVDDFVKQLINNQEMLFRSRQAALRAELASIEESIAGMQAQIQGYTGVLESRRNQQVLLKEELKGVKDLVDEGYAPRSRQLELERNLADVLASIADVQGNLLRTQKGISELKQKSIQRRQEYRKEVDTQLADVRREAQASQEKYKAVSDDLSRTEIKAPVDGQVVGLAVQTVGGVIQAGQRVMDVVPEEEPLIIETRVPPQYIDRVKVGGEADIRFAAFAHSPQLVIKGQIASLSRDLVIDPQSSPTAPQQTPPYYLARVSVTPEGMKDLGGHVMQPGMSAEVIIKTGSRSLMTYLLHPIIRRLSMSLKEE